MIGDAIVLQKLLSKLLEVQHVEDIRVKRFGAVLIVIRRQEVIIESLFRNGAHWGRFRRWHVQLSFTVDLAHRNGPAITEHLYHAPRT
jgi:hypothetical protein